MTQTVFFSRIANREITRALAANPIIAAAPGGIQRGDRYAQGTKLPGILFYMEQSQYFGPVGAAPVEHINGGSYSYAVQVVHLGASDLDIVPIADAAAAALLGLVIDTDDGYQITISASGEKPLPTFTEDGAPYQRLGFICNVTVTKG